MLLAKYLILVVPLEYERLARPRAARSHNLSFDGLQPRRGGGAASTRRQDNDGKTCGRPFEVLITDKYVLPQLQSINGHSIVVHSACQWWYPLKTCELPNP